MPTDKFINALYDLTVDPLRFEKFTQALDQYTKDINMHEGDDVGEPLQGHFERAFAIMEKMGRVKGMHLPIGKWVEDRFNPRVVIDKSGKILSSNDSADLILEKSCIDEFIFDLVHQKSNKTLIRATKKIRKQGDAMPVLVLLKNNTPSLLVLEKRKETDQILVEFSGSEWSVEVSQFLIKTHNISRAELDVAKLMYQGLSLQEIAVSSNRSKETIRKHLRALLTKTDCGSQSQFMRLITGINFVKKQTKKPKWFSDRCKLHTHTLNDGRELSYYDTGELDKLVVVVMHPLVRTPELPKLIEDKINASGYRIIGICRAGYGDSTAVSSKVDAITCSANDLNELFGALHIENFSMIGVMGGSVNCYQGALMLSDRVNCIINISGTIPNFIEEKTKFSEERIKRLPLGVRSMVMTVKYFPKLLPFFARSALALIDSGDTDKIINSFYRDSPVDLLCAQNEDARKWIMRGCRFTAHQGYKTYVNEMLSVSKINFDYQKDIHCPVTLIHSKEDNYVFYEQAKELCANHQNFTLSTIEHSGHMMLYISTQELADRIIEALP